MSLVDDTLKNRYNRIARSSGGLAIVAMDQRDSLRTMFSNVLQTQIPDQYLIDFKMAVAEILSPHASSMLFDRHFGLPGMEVAKKTNSKCGIIIAADHLISGPNQPIIDTKLDTAVDAHKYRDNGATALKFMLIWRGKQNAEQYLELGEQFLQFAHSAGLLGVVEAVIRKPLDLDDDKWDRNQELLEAAKILAVLKPDLYKTEAPYLGAAEESKIRARAEEISSAMPCPWVILSSGVKAEEFSGAVQAVCQGGASGFLAGRRIWEDTLHAEAETYRRNLRNLSVPRLLGLADIVDSHARPWWKALPA